MVVMGVMTARASDLGSIPGQVSNCFGIFFLFNPFNYEKNSHDYFSKQVENLGVMLM